MALAAGLTEFAVTLMCQTRNLPAECWIPFRNHLKTERAVLKAVGDFVTAELRSVGVKVRVAAVMTELRIPAALPLKSKTPFGI